MIAILDTIIVVACVIGAFAALLMLVLGGVFVYDEITNYTANNVNLAADEADRRLSHSERYYIREFDEVFKDFNAGFDNTGEIRYRQRSLDDFGKTGNAFDEIDRLADEDIFEMTKGL